MVQSTTIHIDGSEVWAYSTAFCPRIHAQISTYLLCISKLTHPKELSWYIWSYCRAHPYLIYMPSYGGHPISWDWNYRQLQATTCTVEIESWSSYKSSQCPHWVNSIDYSPLNEAPIDWLPLWLLVKLCTLYYLSVSSRSHENSWLLSLLPIRPSLSYPTLFSRILLRGAICRVRMGRRRDISMHPQPCITWNKPSLFCIGMPSRVILGCLSVYVGWEAWGGHTLTSELLLPLEPPGKVLLPYE